MSSRDDILSAVAGNATHDVPLPELRQNPDDTPRSILLDRFIRSIEHAAGKGSVVPESALVATLSASVGETSRAATSIPDLADLSLPQVSDLTPSELAELDVFVCQGVLGVAENGAVWLGESNLGRRSAPFLTQHLIVILHQDQVVGSMEDAYDRLEPAREGFGLFIAGPSKTADIEQSLVIGAHGPRRHTVFVIQTESGD